VSRRDDPDLASYVRIGYGQSVRGTGDRGDGGGAILKIVRIIDTVVGLVLGTIRLVAYLGRLLVSLGRWRKPLAARIGMYQ
jgi:hypothetical protein